MGVPGFQILTTTLISEATAPISIQQLITVENGVP